MMSKLMESKIIPKFRYEKSEDYFSGDYKGVQVDFFETHLQSPKGIYGDESERTLFKGIVIKASISNKQFYGHTIIKKDGYKTLLNTDVLKLWDRYKIEDTEKGLERAEMVDPEFEKIFDVYTNDQVEARYLIDPIMTEKLKDLYNRYEALGLSVAFYKDTMLILINTKHNHFEPSNINKPAVDIRAMLNIKHDIDQVLSLIDFLNLYDPHAVHKNAAKSK